MNIQIAPKARRKQNPAAVKQNIIDVAIKEFSAHGLAGSSVNVIAEKTDTSKRMIYYYFGGKSALYRVAIEHAYRKVLGRENDNGIDKLNPVQAFEALVSIPFRNRENLDCFARVVAGEKIYCRANMWLRLKAFASSTSPLAFWFKTSTKRALRRAIFSLDSTRLLSGGF